MVHWESPRRSICLSGAEKVMLKLTLEGGKFYQAFQAEETACTKAQRHQECLSRSKNHSLHHRSIKYDECVGSKTEGMGQVKHFEDP